MKIAYLKSTLTAWGLLLLAFTAPAQTVATPYAQSITTQDLERHLRVLADDSLEGRDTGSKGQKKAAQYVAAHFQKIGLQAIVPQADGSKSYFQPYNLYSKKWGEVYLKTEKRRYQRAEDLYVSGLLNVLAEEKTAVVFAGYGIEAANYDDYKNLKVQDKVVVVWEGEPKKADDNFWITGNKTPSKWSNDNMAWSRKMSLARQKGAKYVILVSELQGQAFANEIKKRELMGMRFNRQQMKPYQESISGNAAITVSNLAAADLLGTTEKKLAKLRKQALKTGGSVAGKLPENTVTIKAERSDDIIETENVMGFLEGSDKKDEVIVISAHLDHIGISANGEINNGADDDGSGTVSVMELAEAFAKAKTEGNGPRRSILFMTVTGEEKGLWGSEYYTSNPVIPLAQTVCDLNIDMIGRVDEAHKNDPKYVYIIGSDKLSSELHAISEDANTQHISYKLDYTFNNPSDPNRFYYRSDHYNFAKNKVPVIFYFTGVHEDYHRPGDDVDKIMFDKQSKIVQLVFYTAWELANREARIKVDSNKP
ncbi:MAG: M28 family peptidase [Runella slithyformis]|nr:MAG: M28 family peptidase [Runella slithyformis]TAF01107.1 MAG: M28 family peptidase [Runella slithyformis]TAF29050.1 MAG: M28 family peptidase [Runella slithyformis]TAF48758.1 MAG: M28 family peptidase [Runella slithyformis]TAF79273.1 MAG: M28 family peptidase [Runella slithyformis]